MILYSIYVNRLKEEETRNSKKKNTEDGPDENRNSMKQKHSEKQKYG